MIISNGAAPAALALDELWSKNGKLATLSEDTCQKLRDALPEHVDIANPLDLRDDASSEHYVKTLDILLASQDFDALMVIHSPSAAAPGKSAQALIEAVKHHPRGKFVSLLTNWCGEFSSQEARRLFSEAGLPTYRTPEGTITAFMHMVEYRRNQKQLRETPALPDNLTTNTAEAHNLLQQAIAEGATSLDTHEVQPILQAYGLHTLPTWIASDSAEAVHIAEQIGYPVALKLLLISRISRKFRGNALPAYSNRSAAGCQCNFRSGKNGLAAGTHSRFISTKYGESRWCSRTSRRR
jgi:acetyltransferase